MAEQYELSEGSLQLIMQSVQIEQPVVQVLASQQIPSTGSDKIYCRLLLSDGKHTVSFAMLTSQLNDKIKNELTDNSIVQLKQYVTRLFNNDIKANNREVLIILDMDILVSGDQTTLGNPHRLNFSPKKEIGNSSITSSPTYNDNILDISMQDDVTPISDLKLHINKWVIKAKVFHKSDIYNWSKHNGKGMLFSMFLADESGEIKATVFTEHVHKFYDLIEIDKIYYISNCKLKLKNKQYNNLKHKYEITFTDDTVVEECQDASIDLPQACYDFTTIDKIENIKIGSFIDIIGICNNVYDLKILPSRSNEQNHKKLEATIVDESNYEIALSVWGKRAEDFDGSGQPVIVIKGAKVQEFGGDKYISVVFSSTMMINPDIPEAHRLRSWFDSNDVQTNFTNVNEK